MVPNPICGADISTLIFIWNGSTQELDEFIEHINKLHPNIKFTPVYDIETRSIPFLDMMVCINENRFIETDFHKKKKEKFSIFYLHLATQDIPPKIFRIP